MKRPYTPDAGYVGADQFTYTATDGAESKSGAVTITITNVKPEGQGESYLVHQGETLDVDAEFGLTANDLDRDQDPLTPQVTTAPQNGTLQLNADGSFTYTPDAGFVGSEEFKYMTGDGAEASVELTVAIDVWNNAPLAAADAYRVHQGDTLTVDVASGLLPTILTRTPTR